MHIGISTLMIQRGKTGVAQYLFALLRGLANCKTQHKFTLFILEEDLPLFDFAQSWFTTLVVPEKHRPPVKNILWHQQRLPRLVRQCHIDVLHVPSYRRLLSRKPCRLVATIHDLAPFRVPGKYDWKRMFYGRVVVRWLARRQDRIIAVSRNTANDIRTFFRLPECRIQVVHNGIDHSRFTPGSRSQAKLRAGAQYGLCHPFFLYVARLEHPGKNHVRLIKAFTEFKLATDSSWQLALAGSDWHGAEAVHVAVRNSSCRDDIRTLGFVPESELPALYRAADAFVYPSLYEGFGLPPLEAMACGCPVISSTRGSLGEVIGEAALTVDPEDATQLRDQLKRLATDEPTRVHLRTAGIVQAAKFDWARTAIDTLKVYELAAN